MLKWEYCILSGVETSLKRKLSVSLTFSNSKNNGQNIDVELDSDRNEEMFTTRCLGQLGSEEWEVVAFHRMSPRFEAVLKRPLDLNVAQRQVASEMH